MVLRAKPHKKEEKDRVRDELLHAALRLGAAHGFASLGLREVAREAAIAPTSFYRHFEDMEALGLFANQAAVARQLSRTYENVAGLLADPDAEGADDVSRDAVELARLVQEIAGHGENERKACRDLLVAFAEYLRARSFPLE